MSEQISSNTLCPLPWIHLEATQLGEVRPCCMWEGKPLGRVEDFGKVDFQSHPILKEVRCQMIAGKKPAGCSKCFLMEKAGGQSPRTGEGYKRPTLDYKDVRLEYTNFRFNATCNLACRMCGPWASTRWNSEFDKIHQGEGIDHTVYPVNSEKQAKLIYEELDRNFDSIKEYQFAGGEALLVDYHYKLLERIVSEKKSGIHIRYNTNGTLLKLKNYDVLKLWKQCLELGNTFQVDLSLDAIESAAEYIRYGCTWQTIEQNIQQIEDLRQEWENQRKHWEREFIVCICPTVSILNVYRFPDLLRWGIQKKIITEDLQYVTINNFVTSPPWYDLRILPDSQKHQIGLALEEQKGQYKCLDAYIDSTINFMQGTVPDAKWHQKEFYKYTKRLDILRNQNFLDINPEFEVWYNFLDRRYRKEVLDNWIV